jgi:outer membrane protein OmpA-like peptidoglycan-associated protein
VVIRMTGNDGIDSGQVVLLGYGQYHPLVPDVSPAAQAQNRRVNIVISPTAKFVP